MTDTKHTPGPKKSPKPPKPPRPAWRRWLLRGLYVPVAGVLSVGGFALWVDSTPGHLWLAHTLSHAFDAPGMDLDVKKVKGHAFGTLHLEGVTIRDAGGVWFRATELTLDWRPLALIRDTLAINKVAGKGLRLDHLPTMPSTAAAAKKDDAKDQSDSGLWTLPVAVELDKISLPFTYGDTADAYHLNGSGLALNGRHLTGQVGLESASGNDKLQAQLDWQADARTLGVDLKLDAAEDGLLGSLLGLEDLGALKADLSGAGALTAWKGSFHIKAGAAFAGDGRVEGTETEAGAGRLVLRANLIHALALPSELGGLVGPHLTLKTVLNFGGGSPASVTLDANSGNTQVHLSGPMSADGRIEGGLVTVSAPRYKAGASLGGLRADDAKLEGSFNLRWPAFKLTYTVTADQVAGWGATGEGFSLKGGVELDQYHLGGDFDDLSLASVQYGPKARAGALETAVTAGSGTWDVRRTDGAWRVDNVMLTSGFGTLSKLKAAGTPAGGIGDLSLDANLSPALISRFAPAVVTGGDTDVRLTAATQADGKGLSIDYAAEGHNIDWANDTLTGLVGQTPRLLGHFSLSPDGALTGGTLRFAGQYLSGAGGNIGLKNGALKANFNIDMEGDAPLFTEGAMALPTGIQLAGRVEGPLAHPALTLQTDLTSATGYGLALGDVKAVLTLKPDQTAKSGWNGDLAMTATTASGPVGLGADVSLTGDAVHLGKIAFTSPAVKASGQAAWSGADGLDAMMSATMIPVTAPSFSLKGTASAMLALSGKPDALKGQLDLMASDASLAVTGRFPVLIKALKGRIGFGAEAGQEGYQVDLKLAHLHYGAQQVESLSLEGDTGTDAGLKLQTDGFFANAFKADATFKPTEGGVTLGFVADYGGIKTESTVPVVLGWNKGLTLKAPALAVGDGTAMLDAAYDAGGLDVAAKLSHIPLTAVNTVRAGVFKAGAVDADVKIHRARKAGKGADEAHVNASLSGVRFFTDTLTSSDETYSLNASADMKDGVVTLDASAAAGSKPVGTVTGAVPVERASPGFYAIRAGTPINMAVNWHGDVAPLWLLARRPDHLLEGTLNGKLTLTGDLENPVFAGSLALEDGRYEYETLGLVAENLKLDLAGDNRAVVLKALSATDGNGGMLTGHGSFELSPKLSFPGTLSVSLKDYHMARLDSLDGTASANLSYKRGGTSGKLSGTVTTGTINFLLPKELPTSVVDMDVTEVGSPEESEEETAFQRAKRKPTDLDVQVSLPGHLFVRGRGLDSEWHGDLHVGGTTAVPRFTGAMTLTSGTFMLGGREFTINSGSLTFRGGRRVDPEIAVTATYQTTGLEAVLKIEGPVSAPKFSLTSTPILAEDEILSRVLFGRSVADLTPLQIAEVAVALNGLRGSNAFDLIGQLRRQLGLDKLSITSGEDGEGDGALLTGGKYLRDNVYLEVETSTATAQAVARLKVNITRRFLAESEMGPKRGSSLKIKWFWEY